MSRLFPLALLGLAACNAYRLEPPTGFAEVHRHDGGTRMKAGDNVGLNVTVFNNVRGGTLAFWGADLVRKLELRGYTLEQHTPIRAKNGPHGTRFDFAYTSRDDEPKFYSVLLFVTDEHRVVVELAGDQALADRHRAQLPAIAGEIVVRGCRAGGDLCEGPQPTLTPQPAYRGTSSIESRSPSSSTVASSR